jgi:hypothetical protein
MARRYLAATLAYGFTRAVTYDYEDQVFSYNYGKKSYDGHPLLVADTAALIVLKTAVTPVLWPAILHHDVSRLECFWFDKAPPKYGCSYNWWARDARFMPAETR